ncbi:MAG: hypothetical protein J0L82_18120 [Deltaproteobacteria bacterium]|jgi:hypothetical protein|nr:hypothetical protein [Deltaproteobacteria bacterium]
MKRRRIHTFLLLVLWIGFLGLFQNCAPVKSLTPDENVMKDLEIAIEKTAGDLETLAESNRSCTNDSQCVAVVVGFKGCGGPRDYTYTSLNNDMAAVDALSVQLQNLERDHWNRSGQASTCELVLPPSLACQASLCQVVPSNLF